jgi:hypothetical protein
VGHRGRRLALDVMKAKLDQAMEILAAVKVCGASMINF